MQNAKCKLTSAFGILHSAFQRAPSAASSFAAASFSRVWRPGEPSTARWVDGDQPEAVVRRGAAGREDERRLFGACSLVAQRARVGAAAAVGGIPRDDGEVVEQRGISRPTTHGPPVRSEAVRGLPRVLE